MGFYDHQHNVEEYIKMAKGVDGRELIAILKSFLPNAATVLELGMGPGKDFELLSQSFRVTGSDNSKVFLERYRRTNPEADLVLLDAVTMDIDRRFDCIYSNKVLHHLTKAELKESLENQLKILNPGGLLFHSLWYGDQEEEFSGLRFVYYTEASFSELVGSDYELVKAARYGETELDDSIYFVLRSVKL